MGQDTIRVVNTLEESGVSVFVVREGERELPCHHLFFILSISVLKSALERLQKYQIMFIPNYLIIWKNMKFAASGVGFSWCVVETCRTHARFKDLQCGDGHYFAQLSI